jgi:hypothetical protein
MTEMSGSSAARKQLQHGTHQQMWQVHHQKDRDPPFSVNPPSFLHRLPRHARVKKAHGWQSVPTDDTAAI